MVQAPASPPSRRLRSPDIFAAPAAMIAVAIRAIDGWHRIVTICATPVFMRLPAERQIGTPAFGTIGGMPLVQADHLVKSFSVGAKRFWLRRSAGFAPSTTFR